jgi:predicted dehydrogenase
VIEKSAPEVGLVGCGAWGSLILRDLSGLGCRVHVVARSEASQARAKLGGAHSIVGSVAELPSVEGIVVCTPTPTHARVAEESLRRGVPVFVEKPLTDDPEAAARLADLGAGRLFVMDKWRYHKGVLALADIARSGELGPVQGVRSLRVGWGNPHAGSDSPWILAPHDLSIVFELLGGLPDPRAARIERVGSTTTGLIGLLGGDPWATIEVSTSSPRRERSVRLVCDGGSALLPDAYSDHVLVVRGDPQADPDAEGKRRPVPNEMPLLAELRVFIEHLRGGPPPRSNASDGAKMVRVLADLVSLGEGQRVGSGAL